MAGYSGNQIIFFFLSFNLVDVVTQFLYRQVYSFRPMIVKGDFDLVLVKPVNALFRVLMGGSDLVDLVTIPPLIILIIIYGASLNPDFTQVITYFILMINALLIGTAFYVAILAFGIVTTEIDHSVMIYRDLTNLGKLPIDIYGKPLRVFLTYFIPIGVMMTVPGRAIMGLTTPVGIIISLFVGIVFVVLALRFWKFALTKYTSASS